TAGGEGEREAAGELAHPPEEVGPDRATKISGPVDDTDADTSDRRRQYFRRQRPERSEAPEERGDRQREKNYDADRTALVDELRHQQEHAGQRRRRDHVPLTLLHTIRVDCDGDHGQRAAGIRQRTQEPDAAIERPVSLITVGNQKFTPHSAIRAAKL